MRHSDVYGERRASRVVAVTTAGRAGVPGVLWGLVFGATIAASASSYQSLFPSAASRAKMALTFEGNAAWSALFGPLRRMDTVAGYTAYKSGMFTIILGAIWGLLVATRLLRGEEDAGRWELFLSGRTTRARAALQAATGLGVGVLALWVPTAVLTSAAGSSSKVNIGLGASLFFATAVVAAAAMFMAIGLLVGQLAATRRDANLIGAGILAASYLIRMAADSDTGLAWLRWASPLGWIEELQPLTGSKPFAFVPILALVVVLAVLAVRVARRRDLGASAFAGRETARPRTLLLGGQAGLTIRLTRPVIAALLDGAITRRRRGGRHVGARPRHGATLRRRCVDHADRPIRIHAHPHDHGRRAALGADSRAPLSRDGSTKLGAVEARRLGS